MPILAVIVLVSDHSLAGLRGWTQAQVACAASHGIAIGQTADYWSERASPKVLTWVADAVVRGVVQNIHQEPTEGYPTTVTVAVSHSLKGSETAGGTVSIKLKSGPVYDPSRGEILIATLIPEPTFQVGEQVIVFLLKDHMQHPTIPDHYALQEGEYTIISKGKYLVDPTANLVRNYTYSTEVYSIDRVTSDITQTVGAQGNHN